MRIWSDISLGSLSVPPSSRSATNLRQIRPFVSSDRARRLKKQESNELLGRSEASKPAMYKLEVHHRNFTITKLKFSLCSACRSIRL